MVCTSPHPLLLCGASIAAGIRGFTHLCCAPNPDQLFRRMTGVVPDSVGTTDLDGGLITIARQHHPWARRGDGVDHPRGLDLAEKIRFPQMLEGKERLGN